MGLLHGYSVRRDRADKMRWILENSHSFFVSSYSGLMGERGSDAFPWRLVWKVGAPTKVAFFTWEVQWEAILTMSNLQRRGFKLASRCPMCKMEEETVNHLLIHCGVASDLWSLILSLFGVH
uniref:Reverse transcriptase zinc-binding domain-containing protein n=1 Tax=Davidia involucrata TaxID=16924 RepID=A0A5B7BNT2_DAVIN